MDGSVTFKRIGIISRAIPFGLLGRNDAVSSRRPDDPVEDVKLR
jgi:hypothetical protein